jgi:hypothetical protein
MNAETASIVPVLTPDVGTSSFCARSRVVPGSAFFELFVAGMASVVPFSGVALQSNAALLHVSADQTNNVPAGAS